MATDREVILNKQYRAQIMRIMALFYPDPTAVRQVKMALTEYGMSNQADVSKHLYYLENKGYIKCSEGFIKDIKDDNIITITAKGIDLVEGTISDDGLYL